MVHLREQIKVKGEGLVIRAEENALGVVNFVRTMAPWKKVIFLGSILVVVPGYFIAKYAAETYTAAQLKAYSITAHPAFSTAQPLALSRVSILAVAETQYAAYFQVTNNNLDLSAQDIPYQVNFYNANKEKVYISSGNFYLRPNQKKYIIIPRIDTRERLLSGEVSITQVNWQKKLSLPDVSFRTPDPTVFNQSNPLLLVVQGAVVNSSPYNLSSIKITFLLFDKNNNVIAVSSRDENNIAAFGRRAYNQTWPNIYAGTVARVAVAADTNTMDSSNVVYNGNPDNVPNSSLPELKP